MNLSGPTSMRLTVGDSGKNSTVTVNGETIVAEMVLVMGEMGTLVVVVHSTVKEAMVVGMEIVVVVILVVMELERI